MLPGGFIGCAGCAGPPGTWVGGMMDGGLICGGLLVGGMVPGGVTPGGVLLDGVEPGAAAALPAGAAMLPKAAAPSNSAMRLAAGYLMVETPSPMVRAMRAEAPVSRLLGAFPGSATSSLTMRLDQLQGSIGCGWPGIGAAGVRGVCGAVADPGTRVVPGGQRVVAFGGMVESGMVEFGMVLGLVGLVGVVGLVGAVGLLAVGGGAAVAVMAAAPKSNADRVTDRYRMRLSW